MYYIVLNSSEVRRENWDHREFSPPPVDERSVSSVRWSARQRGFLAGASFNSAGVTSGLINWRQVPRLVKFHVTSFLVVTRRDRPGESGNNNGIFAIQPIVRVPPFNYSFFARWEPPTRLFCAAAAPLCFLLILHSARPVPSLWPIVRFVFLLVLSFLFFIFFLAGSENIFVSVSKVYGDKFNC